MQWSSAHDLTMQNIMKTIVSQAYNRLSFMSCLPLDLVNYMYLQLLRNQIISHSLFHIHHSSGIPTIITKHLYFFSTNNEVKLLGSAKISENQGFIQIPDPSPAMELTYQAGRAIYFSPVRLFDPLTKTPASFQTTFYFQFKTITTAAVTTGGLERGGNGLAFIIVPDEFTIGRPGPWLGILNDACDHYKVFAVEFDNNDDPKFGDLNDDHVGINLGSVVSFKTANLSSPMFLSTMIHSVHRAWIMYDGHKSWIDIYLGLDGYPLSRPTFIIISLEPFSFLERVYVRWFLCFHRRPDTNSQYTFILPLNFGPIVSPPY